MSNKRKFVLELIIIILLLAGSTAGIAMLKGNLSKTNPASINNDETKKPYDVTGNKEKGDIITGAKESEKSEGLRCIISSAPYFTDAKSMGSYCIANHTDNKGYLLQVEISDNNTGELLYISPLLKPGEKIQEDYLTNQEYQDGSYPATATFNFYQAEDEAFYYSVPFDITINIGGGSK